MLSYNVMKHQSQLGRDDVTELGAYRTDLSAIIDKMDPSCSNNYVRITQ